ncbi:uncharacterized protein LY79DRAFT_75064 [Colletotrichum navitas]|uniref:Uncharacterized protein n=1 Tax=Colletotrichum navitas TaxID=681940 RepID=A0AAD8V7M8_9PEZI|nr:uncharacterized protein LY79DRAFT_75064 [Colletotrichum navitas]KAK1596014.1 hypothetical protein LY79DRAFT_75064 [Colletotrichum navitas]
MRSLNVEDFLAGRVRHCLTCECGRVCVAGAVETSETPERNQGKHRRTPIPRQIARWLSWAAGPGRARATRSPGCSLEETRSRVAAWMSDRPGRARREWRRVVGFPSRQALPVSLLACLVPGVSTMILTGHYTKTGIAVQREPRQRGARGRERKLPFQQ